MVNILPILRPASSTETQLGFSGINTELKSFAAEHKTPGYVTDLLRETREYFTKASKQTATIDKGIEKFTKQLLSSERVNSLSHDINTFSSQVKQLLKFIQRLPGIKHQMENDSLDSLSQTTKLVVEYLAKVLRTFADKLSPQKAK